MIVILLSLIFSYCVIMICNWHRMVNFVKFWFTIGTGSLICLIINDMSDVLIIAPEVLIIVPLGFFYFHMVIMLLCYGPDIDNWIYK